MADLIWLTSYPKSGNTWMRALCAAYFGEEPFDLDHLSGLGAHQVTDGLRTMDTLLGVDPRLLHPLELRELQPAAAWRLQADLAAREGFVFQKLHSANLTTATGERLFPAGAGRAVYLVRNPLDVVASWAPFFNITVDEAIDVLADPGYVLNPVSEWHRIVIPEPLLTWRGHVESWLDAPGLACHVVRYEDVVAAPDQAFQEVLAFIGADAPDADRVAEAVASTRFDRLRAKESADGFVERPAFARTPFFRRGRAGGWRDDLTPAQARRVVAAHADVMQRLGYGALVEEVEALGVEAAPRHAS